MSQPDPVEESTAERGEAIPFPFVLFELGSSGLTAVLGSLLRSVLGRLCGGPVYSWQGSAKGACGAVSR